MKRAGQNNLELFGPNMSQEVDDEEDEQESETEINTEVLKNVEADGVDLQISTIVSVNSSSQVRSEVRSGENIHMFPRLFLQLMGGKKNNFQNEPFYLRFRHIIKGRI